MREQHKARLSAEKVRERIFLAAVFESEPEVGDTKMSVRTLQNLTASVALVAALGLAACGTTPGDRAVSGGLLGAGAGAAVGSLTGSAGTGAIIGGLGGAAVGAVTDPCALNLGDPWWRDHGGEAEYRRRCR